MESLAVLTRSNRIESIHRGYLCVTDADDNVLYHIGNPDTKVYLRSAAKPFQVIPLITSGAMEKFKITLKELAIICGSHSGQDFHLEAVKSILNKIGVNEDDLNCGAAYPYNRQMKKLLIQKQENPSPLHNTCSGKHAGMLALCKYFDYPLQGYTNPDHPVQKLITNMIRKLLEINEEELLLGIDGCDVPNYMIPIQKGAYLYSLLGVGKGEDRDIQYKKALALVAKAMIVYPEMVNGKGEFCTELIDYTKGNVIGKMGAEGIYCLAVPSKKIGACIKIADGNERATYPVVLHLLKELGMIEEEALANLQSWMYPQVKNRKGKVVGHIYAVFSQNKSFKGVIGDLHQ